MMHLAQRTKPIHQTLLTVIIVSLLMLASTQSSARPSWKDPASTDGSNTTTESPGSNKSGKGKTTSPSAELIIHQAPTDLYVTETEDAQFSINASMSDDSNISYQWLFNGEPLLGQTDDILIISYATQNDQGIYSVKLTSSLGTSRYDASLSVSVAEPVSDMNIIQQPNAINGTEGDQQSLSIQVSSSRDVSYQWRKNGEILTGQTNPELIFTSLNSEDAGQYDVLLNDGLTTLTSQPVDVQVNPLLATTIALSWDIPTQREDGSYLSPEEISGYQIYLELSEAMLQEKLWVSGELQSVELNEMPSGNYRFAIATIDADGIEGKASDWISLQIN
jgi:hypothetical protein